MQAKGILEQDLELNIQGQNGMRKGSREGLTMRNFIVCTVRLIVRVITFRRLRWAGHLARMEDDGSAFKILTGKSTGRDL